MADAAVSFAVENVGNFLIQEAKFLWGVKDEVEEMQIELEYMQCFLEDAERRKGESRRVRHWVSQIREATYDVEDLIERFFLKSALRNDQKGVVNRFMKYARSVNHALELRRVGSKIKAIKERLTALRKRLEIYGIRELKVGADEVAADGSYSTGRRKRQHYYSHVLDHNVVGRDEKITELVEQLINVAGPTKTSVVCLHGRSGVGKTTTAKKVYYDRRIRRHFEQFAWVDISQPLNRRQVWESTLTQLSGDSKEAVKSMSGMELTKQLLYLQEHHKCFLVIDDIGNNNDWAELSAGIPPLRGDSKSKMLFTTSNEDSKSNILLTTTRNKGEDSERVPVYHTKLDVLDDHNSLLLLTNTILKEDPNHPIKEDSNKKKYAEEVKRCEGLPHEIIVFGRILATRPKPISPMELNYQQLPYHLRLCFLYFSQYREDKEIKTAELKQKWIGEGFVSPSTGEGDETMEDVAEEYLHELEHRGMIEVRRKGHTGRFLTCRIHKRMRDLCISKAKEEGFAYTSKPGGENEGTDFKKESFRRLCISSCNQRLGQSVPDLSSLESISHQLRSIRFQDNLGDDQCKEVVALVKKLKLVRVLQLPSTMWNLMGKREREHVGNLIHLRFLNLEVSMLPTSICNLICLQTLNLERCDSDLRIPDSVWRMEQLRHLYLPRDGGVCESTKQYVCHFKNLQTLVNFPPKNFDLKENLIKFINVKKLVITQRSEEICKVLLRDQRMVFNKVKSLSFPHSSNNVDLKAVKISCPCLDKLVVDGSINFPEAPSCSVIGLSNLTKLVLRHSTLDESHMTSLGKLQSLKVLSLQRNAFAGKEMIFNQNDFPQLHHLALQNLKDLEALAVRKGGLPSLSCLEIVDCWELQSLGDHGAEYLKQLKELKVRSMPYKFKKRLEDGGDYWDRVRNVPYVSFSSCHPEPQFETDNHRSSDVLDENSSLELLNETILSLGGRDHPIRENSEMDTSASEMVKACKGVPLAITLLGRILAGKQEIKEWKSIESGLREGRRKGNDGFTSLLELSYQDLPRHLKPCFLHFSQYVKDEEIKTTELVQRWIGEGSVTSEDVAHEHLKELVSRRLIQVGKRSHRERVKNYRMHEFVWHFCVSKVKNSERLFISSGGLDCKLRGSTMSSIIAIAPQLVSVWFQDDLDEEESKAAVSIVEKLKLVKVLSLPSKIWSLLDDSGREEIGNLDNLTFLKLEGSELPKSVGNLRCLQTLNLERCVERLVIPDSVWEMIQLRHLYLPKEGSGCESHQQKVGDFSNLETLVNFPPDNFDLQQNLVKFSCVRKLVIIRRVGEIGKVLTNKKIVFSKLEALSFPHSTHEGVELEAFTRACPCLYRLFVNGSVKYPAAPSCTSVWPLNLTKLVLRYTYIDQSRLGLVAKLQSLKVLFLQWNAFAGKEMVFRKNDFPQLRHLQIFYLQDLETWDVHEGALSNLLCLEIIDCQKLKSVPGGSQYLKRLKDLRVEDMPCSFRERLEEGGEDWDRVRHVPSISFINSD